LDSIQAVDDYRIRFLSRKQGQITDLLKRIPEVANEHKKSFGQEINSAKALVEKRIEEAGGMLDNTARARIVCDYIAGMTDRYAIREHEKLFDLSWDK